MARIIEITLLLVILSLIGWLLVNDAVKKETLDSSTEVTAESLLLYTNLERSKVGVPPLKLNNELIASAQMKADHHTNEEYWNHNTPEGVEPWAFMTLRGYMYTSAGENLACGYETPANIVDGWMNSTLHREVMLDPDFNEVGFGQADEFDSCGPGTVSIVVGHYGRR